MDPSSRAYWRRNIRYVLLLLAVWFAVAYLGGIVFVRELNQVRIPGTGFPLGFWIAQQGAIYTFVVLIFVYVRLMNRLDREFGVDEVDEGRKTRGLYERGGGPGAGPAAGHGRQGAGSP